MAIVNYYQNGVKSEPIEAKELVGLIKKRVIDKTTIIEVNGQKVEAYRIKQLKPIFDSLPPQEEELEIEPEKEEKAEVKAEEKADENKNLNRQKDVLSVVFVSFCSLSVSLFSEHYYQTPPMMTPIKYGLALLPKLKPISKTLRVQSFPMVNA